MIRLILASRSPRRRELLRLINYPFTTMAADVDESSVIHPDPAVNVILTAQLKAKAISKQLNQKAGAEQIIILAADTTVTLDNQMLGKPINEADAWQMLKALRNRTHQVHTGITLIDHTNGREISDVHTAEVTMRDYSNDEIEAYIATGDPMDKAGAYAIQDLTFRPVIRLYGCYMGVKGLSICQLIQNLDQLGMQNIANMQAIFNAHNQHHCLIYDKIISP